MMWANELLKTGTLPPVCDYKLYNKVKDISVLCKEITQNTRVKTHMSPKRYVTSHDMDRFSDEELEVPTSPQMTVTYDLGVNTSIGTDNSDMKLDPLMSLLNV